MRYEFPADITLDEVRRAVANANARFAKNVPLDGYPTDPDPEFTPEEIEQGYRISTPNFFIEAERGDHTIFNYIVAFEGSFPSPTTGETALDREYAILRECRGLTFCSTTGRIIARKYAKFFNLNEKPETQANIIDWTQPHDILEKLDGSMITPFYVGDMEEITPEKIRWATKMGLTDVAKPVDEWVEQHPHYAAWAAHTMYADFTPIFEWCSRQQRIVIDYPEDRLVLTAIRNNKTGEYLSREAMLAAERSGIEIVRALPGSVENIETFMQEAYDLEGAEGYVVRFTDGHMLKVKGAWYCQIHKTKELLTFEKDVLSLILEDRLDDAKAFMDDQDRARVEAFNEAFTAALIETGERLRAIAAEGARVTGGDKKKFATEFMPSLALADHEATIVFRINSGKDPVEQIRMTLMKNVGTQPRVNGIRHLLGGLRWDAYRDPVVEE
jgi:T4 RnlA family RNA ligase